MYDLMRRYTLIRRHYAPDVTMRLTPLPSQCARRHHGLTPSQGGAMSMQQAFQSAHLRLESGYMHHRYEDEQVFLRAFFHRPTPDAHALDTLPDYTAVLGPTKLRALKNAAICFVTVTCRAAIDEGVPSEMSFALSDYFVQAVERGETATAAEKTMREMLLTYYVAVQRAHINPAYPPLVRKALAHIHNHVYEKTSAAAIAQLSGTSISTLNRALNATLGYTTVPCIHRAKVQEAAYLLGTLHQSVTDVAIALGFANISHFSRTFAKYMRVTPSQYRLAHDQLDSSQQSDRHQQSKYRQPESEQRPNPAGLTPFPRHINAISFSTC